MQVKTLDVKLSKLKEKYLKLAFKYFTSTLFRAFIILQYGASVFPNFKKFEFTIELHMVYFKMLWVEPGLAIHFINDIILKSYGHIL